MPKIRTKIALSVFAILTAAGCAHYGQSSDQSSERAYSEAKEIFNDEIANIRSLNNIPVVDADTTLTIDESVIEAVLAGDNLAPKGGPIPITVEFSSGKFVDDSGNFDFGGQFKELDGAIVKMEFILPEKYLKEGLRFKRDARDAIWIDLAENVKEGSSPSGPYPIGESEFFNFIVSDKGSKLTVFNGNSKKAVYKYGLRFTDKEGNVYQFDPIVDNSGHGGGNN